MGKRGFEARWMEFCEGEPVEVVKAMLRLGQSILKKRVKQEGTRFVVSVPELIEKAAPPEVKELFEHDSTGEPVAPF